MAFKVKGKKEKGKCKREKVAIKKFILHEKMEVWNSFRQSNNQNTQRKSVVQSSLIDFDVFA